MFTSELNPEMVPGPRSTQISQALTHLYYKLLLQKISKHLNIQSCYLKMKQTGAKEGQLVLTIPSTQRTYSVT